MPWYRLLLIHHFKVQWRTAFLPPASHPALPQGHQIGLWNLKTMAKHNFEVRFMSSRPSGMHLQGLLLLV